MLHVVDRFEGEFCIIESEGVTRDVPRKLVDPGVKPGDVVEWSGGKWVANREQTASRSKEIKSLMDELWED